MPGVDVPVAQAHTLRKIGRPPDSRVAYNVLSHLPHADHKSGHVGVFSFDEGDELVCYMIAEDARRSRGADSGVGQAFTPGTFGDSLRERGETVAGSLPHERVDTAAAVMRLGDDSRR